MNDIREALEQVGFTLDDDIFLELGFAEAECADLPSHNVLPLAVVERKHSMRKGILMESSVTEPTAA